MKSLLLSVLFLNLSITSVSKADTNCWMNLVYGNRPVMLNVDPEIENNKIKKLHFTLSEFEFGQVTVSETKNQLDEIILYPNGRSIHSEDNASYIRIPLKGLNFQKGRVNKLTTITELSINPTDPSLSELKDMQANITCQKL